MTSNVGSRWIQELGAYDRKEMENRVTEALRASFKPEFLNRIDEIIVFHNLTSDQLGKIVRIQIEKLLERLEQRNVKLELSDRAVRLLAEKGYDPVYGARPLKRAIQKYIENPLAVEILKGKFTENTIIKADAKGDDIIFQNIPE
ncbi:MAG: AAA family ATPase [Deltaproteobacteria bacterium]|nr:AAA family ATPase [Deltaproteobacteria bacterium]